MIDVRNSENENLRGDDAAVLSRQIVHEVYN